MPTDLAYAALRCVVTALLGRTPPRVCRTTFLPCGAAALVYRYGQQGHPPRPVFDLLLRFAVSEDGALHAEKYFHTVSEEYGRSRAKFRWLHVVALARVSASAGGQPAPGVAEARKLLGV